jgi:hypothetical protein
MHYLSMKENWIQLHYLIHSFKMKIQIKQGFKLFKKTKKYIYIISNLFFDFLLDYHDIILIVTIHQSVLIMKL